MNCKEIRDAALNGKTFTIKNVPIESIEFGDIQSCIDGLGHPVLFKTVNIKFVSPDIIDSVYSDNNDYPNIEVCEKPKYDPYRRFKKGDIVRVVEWNGRDIARVGMEGRVVGNERDSRVELAIDGWKKDVFYPACHLELVTPVEELKPYMVVLNTLGYHVEGCDGKVLATYYTIIHPNAYEAAKAECKRLIDEWRKEQGK